jgi:dienelactone hydrolase
MKVSTAASAALLALGISLGAHAAITKTELAGNPLPQFPYFEYVRAFDTRMSVRVAIDPGRFPAIVGKTCDIFIVRHKSAAAWTANPALVDVTPGGARPRTFVAGTIQANTVSVTPTLSLDDDAGANLGVPYDVVLDCNRNGRLDGNDFIDGMGGEAGFYEVADTTRPGPYAVTTASYDLDMAVAASFGISPRMRTETIYYPSNIASLNRRLPLVVIAHGNAYAPTDYGHIGRHLASWGYVVLAHATDTEIGPTTAAASTLNHTDAFLDQAEAGALAGGVLEGKVDSHRIALMGHSRGGEGVVIAYHRLFMGEFVPAHFTKDDIRLVDAMAPTDIWWTVNGDDTGLADPHDANFHLWVAAGDMDVMGDPADPRWQSQPIADRATNYKQVTVIHGAGHEMFSDRAGAAHVDGPCALTTPEAHAIQLGYLLPLVKHYLEGNIPALDFLTRQYENFHPRGIGLENPCIVVANEYRNGSDAGNFVIDDFQWNMSPDISSAPGGVIYTVENLTEGFFDDNNGSYNYTGTDPFNGALFGTMVDSSRGITFEWSGTTGEYIQWYLPKMARNFTKWRVLSFRGAQASRHPYTQAALEDLRFVVELRDANGVKSAINIGAYGGGLEEPYQRGGGWADEMETIRLRITDFLNNGSALDLTKIVSVRFKFGPSYGSREGRVVLDDLMLTNDAMP